MTASMKLIAMPTVASLLLLLSTLALAAPPDVVKASDSDQGSDVIGYGDVSADGEMAKRLSSFVRIGRPSSFVRIGRASHFVRIGRPGNFVRIGRSYGGDLDTEGAQLGANKRVSNFVRIGRPSSFVRIGKSAGYMSPEEKRMASFVRIGKSAPYGLLYDDAADLNKRVSSFVRIGRSPSYGLVHPEDVEEVQDTKA